MNKIKKALSVLLSSIIVFFCFPLTKEISASDNAWAVAYDVYSNGRVLSSGVYSIFSFENGFTTGITYDPSDDSLILTCSYEIDGTTSMTGMTYDLQSGWFKTGIIYSVSISNGSVEAGIQADIPYDYVREDSLSYSFFKQKNTGVVSSSKWLELVQSAVDGSMIMWDNLLYNTFGYGMEMLIPNFDGNGYSNPITPTPTPKPTATPTPTPAPSYQGTKLPPFDASTGGTGVDGFVERLYSVALGRSSDPTGKAGWVSAIVTGSNTGADAARGFILSTEFKNKGYSNEDFVEVLYRTFFNRTGDAAGKAGWVNVLNNGGSREEVINGFINSTEWANLCLDYGIKSGGTGVPNRSAKPSQGTIDFCTRLYTTCLSRNADQNGLMSWAQVLADQKETGTGAAHGFFFSKEFTEQNVSNKEYVTRLYRTFMGREPDQAGFDAWVGQLDQGVSREEVFQGFAQSNEFGQICASYGIRRS